MQMLSHKTWFAWYSLIQNDCCMHDKSAIVLLNSNQRGVLYNVRIHWLPDTMLPCKNEAGQIAL